ncbi:maleylpyruvate isomerase family mycothiol-dependent enzyme [Actinoplanes sp. NPDC051470]|uniref:maleylpyruvate isomerase family mycothiol-dependent enzyme n=1 Tax=Actinoplanes sp. NPDC051470 TaxID=3157224 RepID=UPI003436F388
MDYLAQIAARSATLRDAVASAPSVEARVPGCPGWTLHDLTTHLGGVQRFWAESVRLRGERPTWHEPSPADELLTWFDASTADLLSALREASPDQPCFTWWGASGAPQTAGAVARHQVQEAAVHAWDAEEAIGKPSPLPVEVASDAIAEFVEVSLGSMGAWPHPPAVLTLTATEGRSWSTNLTPSGASLLTAPPSSSTATVTGTASDLLLGLYGRSPLAALSTTGDQTFDRLRAWVNTD